jgi:hypothetical protein
MFILNRKWTDDTLKQSKMLHSTYISIFHIHFLSRLVRHRTTKAEDKASSKNSYTKDSIARICKDWLLYLPNDKQFGAFKLHLCFTEIFIMAVSVAAVNLNAVL